MNTAGIDVGSTELVVVIQKNGKPGKPFSFENSPSAFKKIINRLKKNKVTRVCMEATGVYHFDLAVALHDSKVFELSVLNPKAARNYALALMTRTKTDALDAAILAEYAARMAFVAWSRPRDEVLAVRAAARRLAALNKQRTQSKNQLHALTSLAVTPAFILADVRLTIEQLDHQIEQMRKHSLKMIKEDEKLLSVLQLLLSIKGVAEASAIQIMGELLSLPKDMQAKQWVAMAGLDPKHHQSGTSVNKQTRISKVGNRYIRMALYMPALSAATHDRYVRGYYLHLIEDRGLKKLQALCAVMRKLLHAIHAMLKNQTTFDNTRFYALDKQGGT